MATAPPHPPRSTEAEGEAERAVASAPASLEAGARAGERERRALVGRAGVVGAGTLASRLLGLGRDLTLAALFTRGQTDSFWVAFTLPNALRQLVGEGAASGAVVPVLAEVRAEEGDEAARVFFARIRGVSLAVLAVVSLLGVLGAPYLVELFAAGLHARPGAFERTVVLTRWVFPYIFFMGTAALGMAALNTHGRFAAAAFAPALLNVAFIACAFLLRAPLAAHGVDPVLTLAAGALLGGALQVVAQWPSLAKVGYLSAPRFSLRDRRVRDALSRMGPMMFGMGIYYVDLVLSRRFLSELPEGSQSYFSWAMRLCDFPQGIFVLALSSATLPSLAVLAAGGHRSEIGKTYAYGMRLALFIALPATLLVVSLAHPLVVALFERGKFDAVASAETARALMAQGLGIWTVAAVRQLVPVFYALGDTRTPVLVSALDLTAFIVLALVLRGPLGHAGVGFAVTGSSAVQMVLLWVFLGRRLGDLHLAEVGSSALRTLGASLVSAVLSWAAASFVLRMVPTGGLASIAAAGLGVLVFAVSFAVAARVFGCTEFDRLWQGVARRLRRSPKGTQ